MLLLGSGRTCLDERSKLGPFSRSCTAMVPQVEHRLELAMMKDVGYLPLAKPVNA
jgi:hypothetical protein